MPVESSDFLESAKHLARKESEMDKRNSISRAYYAAYHASKSISPFLPEGPNGLRGSHEKVIDQLTNHRGLEDSDHKIRSAGYMLQQHRDLRCKADYEIDEEITENEVQQSLRNGEEVLSRISIVTDDWAANN